MHSKMAAVGENLSIEHIVNEVNNVKSALSHSSGMPYSALILMDSVSVA